MKFEKKIYQIFGLPLGRPIRFKAILYFIVIGLVELVLYFTPVLGNLINWIPFSILLVIPIGLAWLLADVGTEDRAPLSFFKSFILFQARKIKRVSYYRNQEILKERSFNFNNYFKYKDKKDFITANEAIKRKEADEKKESALRYIERINNPDQFFENLKQEQNTKPEKNIMKRSNKNNKKKRLTSLLFARWGA